jgi:hypothetical protein
MFSARERAKIAGSAAVPAPLREDEL